MSALSVAAVPIVAMTIGLTYGSILALAIVGAIFDPAGYSARRALIPDAAHASGMDTDRLNGIHEGVFLVGWTAGPLAAAALIASVGAASAFWLPCALFLLAAIAVAAMRVGDAGQRARDEAQAAGLNEGGLSGLVRGFTALWKDRALRVLAIAVLIIAAVYMPTEAVILPAYYNSLREPVSLGIVIAAISDGWILARVRPSVIVRIILIGTTLSVLPMTLLPPLPVLAAFGFILGLVWGPFNPLFSTLVQRRIRPEEQGRVYGVQLACFYAAPPLGMVVAGISVDAFGVSMTYLVLGLLLAACSLPIVFLRSISDLDASGK